MLLFIIIFDSIIVMRYHIELACFLKYNASLLELLEFTDCMYTAWRPILCLSAFDERYIFVFFLLFICVKLPLSDKYIVVISASISEANTCLQTFVSF